MRKRFHVRVRDFLLYPVLRLDELTQFNHDLLVRPESKQATPKNSFNLEPSSFRKPMRTDLLWRSSSACASRRGHSWNSASAMAPRTTPSFCWLDSNKYSGSC